MKHKWMQLPVLALCSLCEAGGYSHETWVLLTSLPQQARLCDVAGVGTVVDSNAEYIDVDVTDYWFGNPGSNTLRVATGDEPMQFAGIQSNIVFFATTNMHYQVELEDPARPYLSPEISPFEWEYPFARTNVLQSIPLSFLGGDRGWFYANEDNGETMNFASNLVVHCRISPNLPEYYSLIRMETTVGEPHARINSEKFRALWAHSCFAGTNLLTLIANDEAIRPIYRNTARERLRTVFNVFLPEE